MNQNTFNLQNIQLHNSFEVNPSTGSARAEVTIPLPSGRNGFGPSLSMSYSSASKNSLFGMGWSLAGLNFISIDIKNGLPKFDESDQYAYNGSASLVPQMVKKGTSWEQKVAETAQFWIYYYRSQQETSFMRFEKWVSKADGQFHWRTRSKNNIESVYGLAAAARIANPDDSRRVFLWLIETQYDHLGNCIQFQYVPENGDGVDALAPYEQSRLTNFHAAGFPQKYPERILFGNSQPILPDSEVPANNRWSFEIVFDYGQYPSRPLTSNQPAPGSVWAARLDPFSSYTGGFEIRTYRLCRRLLVFNNFDDLSTPTSLTGIFACRYSEAAAGTTLAAMTFTGVRRDLFNGTYTEKSVPELTFQYTQPAVARAFQGLAQQSVENIPQGLNQIGLRFVDVLSEGIPGILLETAGAWYYKPNQGDGLFGKQEILLQKPAHTLGIYSLGDFDQNGNINLFSLSGRMAGFYEYDRQTENWSGFQTFANIPQVEHSIVMDVNADGILDLVVECEDKVVCYPFKGKAGFEAPFEFSKPRSNGALYAPVLGDHLALDYFLADMTGDGLPDQVRILNGQVVYFPNLGNGRFGEAVFMKDAPVFDFDGSFDSSRIRLYDLDGSGTTDILYIGKGEIRFWYNASGNSFIEGGQIGGLPVIDNVSSAVILDLFGLGTASLVWSTPLTTFQNVSLQYLELTSGVKPRLLTSLENGMGKQIQIDYGYSGQHYLEAKKSNNPWISKMPFHFPVVDKTTIVDRITNSKLTTQYSYRDGHYDGHEHRFVTFGLVDIFNSEVFGNPNTNPDPGFSQPACTRSWFHNGLFGWQERRIEQYYRQDATQPMLTPEFFEQADALDAQEFASGYRSLAGQLLRQEIYTADFQANLNAHPFQVSQTSFCIRKLQPSNEEVEACFYAYPAETLTITYEQAQDDPKVAHHLTLGVDEYGEIEKDLSVAYARRNAAAGIIPAQSKDYLMASVHRYQQIDTLNNFQAGILFESRSFEINAIPHPNGAIFGLNAIQAIFDSLTSQAVDFDQPLPLVGPAARLTSWERTFFWDDSLSAALPLGQIGDVVLAHHEESASFTDTLIQQVYAGKVTQPMLSNSDEGNYVLKDGHWWQHTPINHFNPINGFFSLAQVERDGASLTAYQYDTRFLNVIAITDPLNNVSRAEIDYNLVAPFRLIDPNDNISEVLFDPLGVAIVTSSQGTLLDPAGGLQPYGNGRIADYVPRSDESFERILTNPERYLQQAETFIFNDLDAWQRDGSPLRSIRLTRENLVHDGKGNIDPTAVIQVDLDYQDGFGRVIQSKRLVEAGPAVQRLPAGGVALDVSGLPVLAQTDPRWLVSGHIIYNNKQQAIQQFEPFFSGLSTFEDDEALNTYGVSAQNHYDAVGRLIRSDFPNGTFTEAVFTPWEMRHFDQNDNVGRSLYKSLRTGLPTGDPERMALDRSLNHSDTPVIVQFDPLGREVRSIRQNNDGTQRIIENVLDINGNIAEIRDARGLTAFIYKRDMLGRQLRETSVDAGEKWGFFNNQDQIIHLWDGRNVHQRVRFDQLDRTVSVQVDGALGLNQVTERYQYGEDPAVPQAKARNLRGQLVKRFDQAGTYEVKLALPNGKPSAVETRLLDDFKSEPDWAATQAPTLGADLFASAYTYDSLGRPISQTHPDQTTRQFVFNRGGGVQKVLVSTADGSLNQVEIFKDATYDANGLRQTVRFGNDVETNYTYDEDTFRMVGLRSRKSAGTPRIYQDLKYTYDPVGNLIFFVDDSQQPGAANPFVIQGLNVSSHSDFEYDALYQLTAAKGRVHQALLQNDYIDRSRETGVPQDWIKGTRHISLNNGQAVERYTRQYEYDPAGNIKRIRHQGASQSWTSEIWISPTSNRSLPRDDLNGIAVANPESWFDSNGNCIFLPHLVNIDWNYRNNIARVVVIDRSAQGKPNDEEFYVYNSGGGRVRKVSQRVTNVANNTLEITEKIYLDGCEIKRITLGGTEILKRFTSAITDGANIIALVHAWETDTLARETDTLPKKRIHYQLGNHLGSAALELDENGDLITYEEYFPYGGTSFVAGKNQRDIRLKDYRYSGKERDDTTGLYYFGYRYYAHWLGSWLSPDPLGPTDSENLYLYVQNNPINLVDPNGLQTTRGSVHYVAPTDLAALFADFRANLTEERIAELQSEGRTILHYNAETGTVVPITREEALALVEAIRASGEDVAIEAPAVDEPELEPPDPEDVIDTSNGPVTVDFEEEVLVSGSDEENPVVLPGDEVEISTAANGESADATGRGRSKDSSSGGVNNGTGQGQNLGPQTNGGGGGGNTGDGAGSHAGSGSEGSGPGAGLRGTGPGGGGSSASGIKAGSGSGSGTGSGAASGAGQGSAARPGAGGNGKPGNGAKGTGKPGGARGGQVGGSVNGVLDGKLGGVQNGAAGGQPGGDPAGSDQGDSNGIPDGSASGQAGGTSGSGSQLGGQPQNGEAQGTRQGQGSQQGAASPNSQGQQGQQPGGGAQQGQGQAGQRGDPNMNWMDKAIKYVGYLNLEFGDGDPNGEAGGIPGGLDLFGWRPPMWVRRTLQVVYTATTIITTVIPLGKAAIAAKTAVQGALKAGFKATARKVLTAIAEKIPTRAGMRAAVERFKASISSGFSSFLNVFSRSRSIARDAMGVNGLLRFGEMSGGAQRIVQQFQTKGRIFIGSGAHVNDLRQASMYLGREIGVATDGTGRLVAVLGSETRTVFRFSDNPFFHTHPVFVSEPGHFALDIRSASSMVEAVCDWGGNITHFNNTGILTEFLSSPINALGYVVGHM